MDADLGINLNMDCENTPQNIERQVVKCSSHISATRLNRIDKTYETKIFEITTPEAEQMAENFMINRAFRKPEDLLSTFILSTDEIAIAHMTRCNNYITA